MSIFNIHSAADLRAFLYLLLPTISALLVTQGVLDESQASLWAGLATSILGPVLAFVTSRSVSSFRSAFYALLGSAQAIVVGYGLVSDEQIGIWLPLISAIVGVSAGGVAVANTDTTPSSNDVLPPEAIR